MNLILFVSLYLYYKILRYLLLFSTKLEEISDALLNVNIGPVFSLHVCYGEWSKFRHKQDPGSWSHFVPKTFERLIRIYTSNDLIPFNQGLEPFQTATTTKHTMNVLDDEFDICWQPIPPSNTTVFFSIMLKAKIVFHTNESNNEITMEQPTRLDC